MKIRKLMVFFLFAQLCFCQEDLEQLYYPVIELGDIPYEFAAQVHSLDDFMKRFNGIHNGVGRPYDKSSQLYKSIRSKQDVWQQFRKKVIISLFDRQFFMSAQQENTVFVDYLMSISDLSIHHNRILASVHFTSLYDCSMVFGAMLLEFMGSKESGFEWQIVDVVFEESIVPENIVKEVFPSSESELFIPPNAHNNNFVNLHRLINQQKDLTPYISRSTKGISIFHHLMRYPEFSIEFTETRFMIEIEKGNGFVLDKHYKIIACNPEALTK